MIEIDDTRDILGIIDVQPTFMPGGELPVPDGGDIVPVVNALLEGSFAHAFATQDWHPAGHSSFASTHGRATYDIVDLPYGPQTLWPDHALIGSPGAALHAGLDLRRVELILRKGFRPAIDSYSAFRENDRTTTTGLHGFLSERGYRRIFLCGLATDFCVSWSAEDAAALGYEVFVIEDACRGIGLPVPGGGTTLDVARRSLVERGVGWVTRGQIG